MGTRKRPGRAAYIDLTNVGAFQAQSKAPTKDQTQPGTLRICRTEPKAEGEEERAESLGS